VTHGWKKKKKKKKGSTLGRADCTGHWLAPWLVAMFNAESDTDVCV
jgi:hypothetical protein